MPCTRSVLRVPAEPQDGRCDLVGGSEPADRLAADRFGHLQLTVGVTPLNERAQAKLGWQAAASSCDCARRDRQHETGNGRGARTRYQQQTGGE